MRTSGTNVDAATSVALTVNGTGREVAVDPETPVRVRDLPLTRERLIVAMG